MYVQTTNNHSEGFNNRLGTKRKLGKHPNVYKWTDDIISELQTLYDNILLEMAGNPNSKAARKKNVNKKDRKVESMKQLEQGNVDLFIFIIHMF